MSLRARAALSAALAILPACASRARDPAAHPAQPKESVMSQRAKGAFDVKVTPQESAPGALGNHLRFEKQFRGDLEATSRGEMFTSETAVEGSAGYVGREQITGTLAGRRGTFTVQHLGTMRGGAFALRIEIVPDSGTEQLAGLTGSMKIVIEPGGKHFYELDYAFDEKR